MASGIETNNVDLDSLFVAYVGGHTHAALTGIQLNGVDLNQRYDNISYGSAGAATGILSNSLDLNTFFAGYASEWAASLPTFPAYHSSPQPSSGTNSMTVTTSGGPGGTYTYAWSSVVNGAPGTAFYLVSGQGTATITWYATAPPNNKNIITVSCKVTATSGASVTASTAIVFFYFT